MSASQPIPAESGGIERVPPPPPGVAAPEPPAARPSRVDAIPPPPPLFPTPASQQPPAAKPLIVPTVDITVPPVVEPAGVWRLVVEGGRTFELLEPRILLGRDPAARPGTQHVAVHDPTRTVSKTHALLELVDDVWSVTDLGSTNGVIVAEPDGSERVLAPGIPAAVTDRFALGQVWLRLRS